MFVAVDFLLVKEHSQAESDQRERDGIQGPKLEAMESAPSRRSAPIEPEAILRVRQGSNLGPPA